MATKHRDGTRTVYYLHTKVSENNLDLLYAAVYARKGFEPTMTLRRVAATFRGSETTHWREAPRKAHTSKEFPKEVHSTEQVFMSTIPRLPKIGPYRSLWESYIPQTQARVAGLRRMLNQ